MCDHSEIPTALESGCAVNYYDDMKAAELKATADHEAHEARRTVVQKVLVTGIRPARSDGSAVPWKDLAAPPGEYTIPPKKVAAPKKPKDAYLVLGRIVAPSAGRYVINGVLIEEYKGRKVAVGTDGHALVVLPYSGDLAPGVWSKYRPKVERMELNGRYPKHREMLPTSRPLATIEVTPEIADTINAGDLAAKMGPNGIPFRFVVEGTQVILGSGLLCLVMTVMRDAGFVPTLIELHGVHRQVVIRTTVTEALAVIAPISVPTDHDYAGAWIRITQ